MERSNNIKTTLNEIKREQTFKVPENYFEHFPVKMANLIAETRKEKGFVTFWETLQAKLIPVIVISGFTLLIATTAIVYQFRKEKELTVTELADLYRYTAINDANETDLIKELERVTNATATQSDSISKSPENFSNEAIDFLKNENMDINTVIDAL